MMLICECCRGFFRKILHMASFRAFLNSPVGPKTTHFWGPVANWGFVVAVCFRRNFFLYFRFSLMSEILLIVCGSCVLWASRILLFDRGWWTWRNLLKWFPETWLQVNFLWLIESFDLFSLDGVVRCSKSSVVGCWCRSNVCVFRIVHEVCMDGSTSQLSSSSMPCFEWDCTTLSTLPLG